MEGMDPDKASYHGAHDVTMPVLAATLTTIVVFVPVFFLSGISAFLFAPLARSVALSIGASFVVAMMVIPLLMKRVRVDLHDQSTRFQQRFDQFKRAYQDLLPSVLKHRRIVYLGALGLLALMFVLYPFVGKELFPGQDVGHMTVKLRMPSGTRIEKTEERIIQVEQDLGEIIPSAEIETVVSNLGVLYDWPAAYTPNSGPSDAFMEIQLTSDRSESSQEYAHRLRQLLQGRYPDMEVVVDTGTILTAALTFGLQAPIDIQINGNDLHVSKEIADRVIAAISDIEGLVDVRIQQRLDYPQLTIDVDRRKAAQLGLTAVDVVKNVVAATNSSVTFDPVFWIDPINGNHYFAGAQYREEDLVDLDTLKNIPITSAVQDQSVPLMEIASFGEQLAPTEINHVNISRVLDIFANVHGRDLGSVSVEIERRLEAIEVPAGYSLELFGEWSGLKDSFENLLYGLLLAVFLVYLILVAQFRSLKDPIIVLVAVPLGFVGVIAALWITGSSLNIQSFLGTIFMVGIVVSNSILIVEFANRRRQEGLPLEAAVVDGCATRLRPILMTSLAAILGLLPMAIGFGHGAEANVPLARAVIGGLFVSTFLSLFVVPCVYVSMHRRQKFNPVKGLSVLLLLAVLGAVPQSSAAADADVAIGLNEAVIYAEEHHPLLKAAASHTAQGTWNLTGAYSGYLPQIQGGIVESKGMNGSYGGLGFNGIINSAFKRGYGVGVELEQTIFDFGRTHNRIRSARADRSVREAGETLLADNVVFSVNQAYFECQLHRALTGMYAKAGQQAREMSKEISRYVKTGQRTAVDGSLIKVMVTELAEDSIEAENAWELSIDRLNLMMGAAGETRYSCLSMGSKEGRPEKYTAQELDQVVERALEVSPELHEMSASKQRAVFDRRAARSGFLPEIVGVASVGDLQNTVLLPETHYAVGVGLRVPIFQGLEALSKYKTAKLEEDRLDFESDYMRKKITAEVRRAHRDERKDRKLMGLASQRRREARKSFDLARKRYLRKAGPLTELDQAYEAWLESETNYWHRRYAERVATVRLQMLLGELR